MITGGRNLGRVGTVVNRERHPGSFDIVHIKDANGHTFATRYCTCYCLLHAGNMLPSSSLWWEHVFGELKYRYQVLNVNYNDYLSRQIIATNLTHNTLKEISNTYYINLIGILLLCCE